MRNTRAFGLLIALALLAACAPKTETPSFPSPISVIHSLTEETPTPTATLRPYPSDTPTTVATATPVATETPVPTPTPTLEPVYHVVDENDVMFDIALYYGVSLDALKAANPTVIPNAMRVGTVLLIPVTPTPAANAGASPTASMPLPTELAEVSLPTDCYRDSARGVYCFVTVANTSEKPIENISAIVSLGSAIAPEKREQIAILPFNILHAGKTLPLVTYFMPPTPEDFTATARLDFSLPVSDGTNRYLPASVINLKVALDEEALSAEVRGDVFFVDPQRPASSVWVLGVAYSEDGHVLGIRRWEAKPPISTRQTLPFNFTLYSIAGKIDEVKAFVEVRPIFK